MSGWVLEYSSSIRQESLFIKPIDGSPADEALYRACSSGRMLLWMTALHLELLALTFPHRIAPKSSGAATGQSLESQMPLYFDLTEGTKLAS
jgi:hypothetical protein